VRRSEAAAGAEYEFARYNRTQQLLRYTEEEYARLFAPTDVAPSRWTRADTDVLLDLCERFDLRWPVITDRFASAASGPRTMEELKDRYYFIAGTLARERIAHSVVPTASMKALASFEYLRAQEEQRKAMTDKLFRRSHELIQEEEELMQVLARIEQQTASLSGKRKEAQAQQQQHHHHHHQQRRSSSGAPQKKRKKTESDEEEDVHADESGEEGEQKRRSRVSKSVPHAQVCSAQLLHTGSISKETATKLQEILDNYGVSVLRSYTSATVDAFLKLRKSIIRMLELKKHIAKREYVVSLLQQQLQAKKC